MEKLFTKRGLSLPEVPWDVYPRPQMVREEWLCLNGMWNLTVRGKSFRKDALSHGSIRVPFCAESLLSAVSFPCRVGDELQYARTFTLPADWVGKRILLHFGAVSRRTEVAVNGKICCRHDNGYLPFSADITSLIKQGKNEITVLAVNDLTPLHPYGKQSKKRGGMWYTPCSGIWQTVWLECVPEKYIRALHIRTDRTSAEITAEGVEDGVVEVDGQHFPLTGGKASVTIPSPHCWTPEDPFLYPFTVTAGEDKVVSYFALRELTVERVGGKKRIFLNGKPFFFHALLDQGYWSDGLYTPADPICYEEDILYAKSLGFNTLRKHAKIEPELYYAACDRLGMIVFQDMVNAGAYSYLRDTVLPTLHFQKRNDTHLHRNPDGRRNFLHAMEETVSVLGSHPCLCLWTIFNEGWGQFCADDAYRKLKALDPSRLINSTSGWFHQKESDVDAQHLYFEALHLGKRTDLPQMITEFGGYVWKDDEHSFNREKTYGYRKYATREELADALREVYGRILPPLVREGLCGAVYTQLSDVEDETNGLLTFDRSVQKIRPEHLADLSEQLQQNLQEA